MDQTPKRPRSSTDLKPVLDQTPEPDVVGQRRFDSPKRTTLTDLPAAQPADRKPTLSGMPAPPVPLEYASTKRPPLPWNKTVRAASPPPLVAASRRTDPPAGAETTPTAPETPVPESLPGGQAGGPTSQRAEDRERVLERELAKQRAKVAELERDARAAAEARSPAASYPPPVTPAQQAPAPKVETPAIVVPETFRGVTLAQAKIGFLVGLTAVLTPLAGYIAWQVGQLQSGKDRTTVQANQAANEAQSAKVGTTANDKELAALREKFCNKDALYREVWRRQGVVVPADDGDCAAPALKQTTPLRKPGEIKPGPTLILDREQPP